MVTKYLCIGVVVSLTIICITGKPTVVQSLKQNVACFDPIVNKTFKHGEDWEQPFCSSCTCDNGTISCLKIACPDISTCVNVSTRISGDQCCASCLDSLPILRNVSETCYDRVLKRRYRYSDTWNRDKCISCTCTGDSEEPACKLTKCPLLKCDEMVNVKGQCCPVCKKSVDTCEDLDLNKIFQNGDSWKPNDCSSCTCDNGKKICALQSCAPMFCANPIRKPGKCCPECPERDFEKCQERTTNITHKEGDSWFENDGCSFCTCVGGQTLCASPTCVVPECPGGHVINVKGICCPICFSHKICTDPITKKLYTEGNVWQNDSCSLCKCTSDGTVCNEPNEDIEGCSNVVQMNKFCNKFCLDKPDVEP